MRHLAHGLVECTANRTPLACDCVLRQAGTGTVAIPLKPLLREKREEAVNGFKAARQLDEHVAASPAAVTLAVASK